MQSHSFYKINSERSRNKGIEEGKKKQKNGDRKGEGKELDKIKSVLPFREEISKTLVSLIFLFFS